MKAKIKICCDMIRAQILERDLQGMLDFLVHEQNKIYLCDPVGRWELEIQHCPFCGKKLEITEVNSNAK